MVVVNILCHEADFFFFVRVSEQDNAAQRVSRHLLKQYHNEHPMILCENELPCLSHIVILCVCVLIKSYLFIRLIK